MQDNCSGTAGSGHQRKRIRDRTDRTRLAEDANKDMTAGTGDLGRRGLGKDNWDRKAGEDIRDTTTVTGKP